MEITKLLLMCSKQVDIPICVWERLSSKERHNLRKLFTLAVPLIYGEILVDKSIRILTGKQKGENNFKGALYRRMGSIQGTNK